MSFPAMTPSPGQRLVRYAGDRLRVELTHPAPGEGGWRALLRTNLTRAAEAREEIIALSGARPSEARTFAGASWRDIPLKPAEGGWELDLALTEPGYFRAKAYCVDPEGRQHWPAGEDVGIAVQPDHLRTGNTLYCAFPRMFGEARTTRTTRMPALEEQLKALDLQGYAVIPPSGKLRDLTACVPHILGTLGCRILHLLPVGPTPTTYARMGRFGSPYAILDLTGIDPALVDFDRRTTAVDQFRELAYAVHLRGGLVFLDIVVNHTGWGSRLQDQRPGWFKREPGGAFRSPGAWGVTWGDLVELDNRHPELWELTADALLTWCRRGVDGFRCDAGYMVPVPAWQYLVARVHQEFPGCTFLLEGLGGAWEATEALLTEGGMQWAYSELFQNHTPREVSGYLDHVIRQSGRVGPLIHYSETHDNDRLAKQGAAWSLLRNRLCALASQCGGFGFTGGVEWLAAEKIDVHEARGMAWGAEPNLVPELARINRLLKDHPCFFDGARLERLSPEDAPVLALRRTSQDGLDRCLVLVNLDPASPHDLALPPEAWEGLGPSPVDLLEQEPPGTRLEPGACFCLAASHTPAGLAGDAYRALRAQAALAYRHLEQVLPCEKLGPIDWRILGGLVARDPAAFLACLPSLDEAEAERDLAAALASALAGDRYRPVVTWRTADVGRVVPVPPGHWLLVQDDSPFEITLRREGRRPLHLRSVPGGSGFFAAVFPAELRTLDADSQDAELVLDRFAEAGRQAAGRLRLLAPRPRFVPDTLAGLALLTNGRGAMVRLHADLGAVASKYDCLLGANLHPSAPCDRHVLAKRVRAWIIADGFLTALDGDNLVAFEPGPPARWVFVANAGDGRTVEVALTAGMVPESNTVVLEFTRPETPPRLGEDLPAACAVSLTLRVDLEDRGFHAETRADPETGAWWAGHTRLLADRPGFLFAPAEDRTLRCWAGAGSYHPGPEWCLGLPHPVEASRGMASTGDAWSPGWFDVPLPRGGTVTLTASAEPGEPPAGRLEPAPLSSDADTFGGQLRRACSAFLVRRDEGRTVIAGYPWFLDWGRDALVAARGLLAAGHREEVLRLLLTFARLEDRGTLPNMLAADSTANRDTSDAPLWFSLACDETATALGAGIFDRPVDGQRALREVLASIARNYLAGTPNGILVDHASGLVWSPPHFTWMDTNYPAGTPREGYPVEIQALWIHLLRQLERLEVPGDWGGLAALATASLEAFWNEEAGCLHDLLGAPRGKAADLATPDGQVRPNQLFAVTLGLVPGIRARRIVETVSRFLLVPGALRSLAPLPVPAPAPILAADGRLLNDPLHPYWGRYEGDEDTRRKPAYHNGTAWCWLLPTFCEALARAWDFSPEATAAARAYLGSSDRLLKEGCVGHLPEILDGDAPHLQRGCDAQAWSAAEAFRVWELLASKMGDTQPMDPR
ncbi:MAG TPA: amylo-alpha-1,6-glucosidase [Holophaga sp.]|nr:amylo-alpha-1,6-glucosidase [Holophaga sp.]HPS66565.1 amylo-alpha-1,6-glucosidase [Holophaga sp.]